MRSTNYNSEDNYGLVGIIPFKKIVNINVPIIKTNVTIIWKEIV